MSEYTEIRYEVDGHVGLLTIDRPEAHNALTHTTDAELQHAVEHTEARCLVLTGADPSFCSGDDVKQVTAAELLFTGRVITADEARELGLARRVVAHDELLASFLEKREPRYVGR